MKRIAFDVSSFLKTCLYGGKDEENGREVEHEGKGVWVNSAYHGYDKCVSRMLDVLKLYSMVPIQVVLVVEGDRSKQKRLMIDAQYKASRGTHPAESNEEFHKAKNMLIDLWLGLGALALTQDLAEGDDTLAWLALNVEEDLVIATFDNDLSSLNMTNSYGANVEVWVNDLAGVNKYGLFDFNLITTYKALVGDTSDNIKGATGFGVAAFEKFCTEYGYDGLAEVQAMLLKSDLSELEKLALTDKNKQLRMIADQKAQVQRSFDLARLRPEWVNTMAHPLQWRVGRVRQVKKDDDPRLKPWYGRARLITAENFADAAAFVLEKMAETKESGLDIETATPDESDEWLANQRSKSARSEGVDVFGSFLCGLGLTFGANNQYTFYFSVNHAETDNIASEDLRRLIAALPQEIPLVIQNTSFELVVLFNEWADRQVDNGYHGFLPNVLDTKIEANYVNENIGVGLKESSLRYLGYKQQSYDETTKLTGPAETLPKGGRLIAQNYLYRDCETGKMVPSVDDPEVLVAEVRREVVEYDTGETEDVIKRGKVVKVPIMAPVVESVTRQYKMNELTARHVFGYGADDPICTIALHNFYKFNMQVADHHWQVYLDVEIAPCYQHAKNFLDGVPISLEDMNEQAEADTKIYDESWAALRAYLISKGWAGTAPPKFDRSITPAQLKEAYTIRTGEDLGTAMRTMSKLVIWLREEKNLPVMACLLERMIDPAVSDPVTIAISEEKFTAYVNEKFTGEPDFNDGSPIQMCRLLYETMGLPVRVRNKATEVMRGKGIYDGNPKADALAIQYAEQDAPKELLPVITALKLMGMVGTRRGLYYNTYPYFPHWKDGLVRSQHNQTSTNTRRASTSKPNLQQLPKIVKIEGYDAKFRSIIRPHKANAVVVSIDFDSQEMRVIGEQSGDKVVLSMFVGDNLTGPHSLTGLAIAKRKKPRALGDLDWSYEAFEEIRGNKEHSEFVFVKACRVLGKKLNFVAEYGAMAPKVAATLLISEEEAQELLDAREEMYPDVVLWKKATIAEAKKVGYVLTMLGAKRHLRDAFMSDDRFEASKAERQAINFKVQSSSGEMTKQAEGRMWDDNLYFDFDAACYGPIHDEVVSSCVIDQLVEFIQRKHACMAVQYAGMKVPVIGSISFGLDFYNQVEIGTVPTREAIEAGLKKMYAEATKREAAKQNLKLAA